MRSIPACAGEPASRIRTKSLKKVYPRVCGGTCIGTPRMCTCKGLSPRVRGNLCAASQHRVRFRSIPACAGEPVLSAGATCYQAVYPRVCGGTSLQDGQSEIKAGLSPRVRGNRRKCGVLAVEHRSIPACAGEPRAGPRRAGSCAVYPRVCGGTPALRSYDPAPSGLSPRVRGNPIRPYFEIVLIRSIPACAGEPL